MRVERENVVRKVVAAICYVVGVVSVLYVAFFLPYAQPEHTETVLLELHWSWFVIGLALVVAAPLIWPESDATADEGTEKPKRSG